MAVTEGKKKNPPTFPYLHKSRAKRLKKSWIEDHKIRSKWKAQKRRDGLTNQTSAPVEDASSHPDDQINADSGSDTSPDRPESSPIPTPSHDKQSLRDLRRLAYASEPICTPKTDPLRPKRTLVHSPNDRSRKATTCVTGQPNMKLRMNVLLEKIKRDFP